MSLTCPNCAAEVENVPLQAGQVLRCGRCDEVLKKYRTLGAGTAAASLALCGLILLGLANVFPIMNFSVMGKVQSNEILTGVKVLAAQGYGPIGLLVLLCAVVAPTLYFAGVFYSAASCSVGRRWVGAARAVKLAQAAQPWSLLPVFALACLVSAVKLDLIGQVTWQPGVWLIGLVAVNALIVDGLYAPDEALAFLESSEPCQ